MENPVAPIYYCKLCINLGLKGIILTSSSNPMKEINEHIQIHRQQLRLLEKNKNILLKNKICFLVKKSTVNQNPCTFTIEKEIDQDVAILKELYISELRGHVITPESQLYKNPGEKLCTFLSHSSSKLPGVRTEAGECCTMMHLLSYKTKGNKSRATNLDDGATV